MKIILATSNAHKVAEFKMMLKDFELYSLDEFLKPFEIEENGKSFKENALIKSKAVFNALHKDKEFIALSDDSGICVDALEGKPGIYSARFSKEGTDSKNREKLIKELCNLKLKESKAHYKAAIGLSSYWGDFCTQGSMHGKVIGEERGSGGFGYDSMFIPKDFDKTLAELSSQQKNAISHRFKALDLARIILRILQRLEK